MKFSYMHVMWFDHLFTLPYFSLPHFGSLSCFVIVPFYFHAVFVFSLESPYNRHVRTYLSKSSLFYLPFHFHSRSFKRHDFVHLSSCINALLYQLRWPMLLYLILLMWYLLICICWTSLCPWNKASLIMMNDLFNVLLNLIFEYCV